MPENDFEKAVHHELESFKLKPSDAVWHNVEQRIARKKERRRFIFLWLPLLLAGTAAVYFYSTGRKEKSNSLTDAQASTDTRIPIPPDADKKAKQNTTASVPVIPDPPPADRNKKEAKQPVNTVSTLQKSPVILPGMRSITAKETMDLSKEGIANIKAEKKKRDLTNRRGAAAGTETVPAPAINDKTIPVTIYEDQVNSGVFTEQWQRNTSPAWAYRVPALLNTEIFNKMAAVGQLNQVPGTDSASLAASVSKGKQGWQKGIMIKGGMYSLASPVFGFGEKAADYNYSSSPATGGTGSQTNTVSAPSPIRSSATYGVGLELKRPVGKRNFFVTGIGAGVYQTVRKVGAYQDSSGSPGNALYSFNSYYRVDASEKDYTSRYYYLEIPVGMQWRLIRNDRFPVWLGTGLMYSRLLGSRGLVYSSSNNFYIDDKQLLNPDGLSARLSLSTSFFQKSKHPVEAGVFTQYGLTPQYREQSNIDMHGHSAGIKITTRF